jgi:uncharacterized protein (TIGR00369 family)
MSERTRTFTWEDPLDMADAIRELSGLERLRRVMSGELPPPPMARLMDIALVEASEGRAVFEATPSEFHYNPTGVVHGGFAATLLDSAMGCAVHTLLPAHVGYTTLEFKINFLRAITLATGRLRATASVLHAGRTTALADGRLEDMNGRLYACATTTCLILGGDATEVGGGRSEVGGGRSEVGGRKSRVSR